jgi:tRNA(Ile)-lysidine synthase
VIAGGAARTVAVAVSGGRDSMALLHCTARAARALAGEVIALHVHHGLLPEADAWAGQVERVCRRWSVRFALQHLAGKPARGESVEAWARSGRYRALAAMAHDAGSDLVLLAHHRRDQAETFLLQALRGAGPRGLAAMPQLIEREGIVWARPWLAMPDEVIDAYVRRHRLRFAQDPSNSDPRYARSRLRAHLMPTLEKSFPGGEASLAAAAARCAEAAQVLHEVARADQLAVGDGSAVRLVPWRALSEARRRNVLHAWLHDRLGRGAPQTLVDRLMRELPASGPAQWSCEGTTLRRYRGRLEVAVDPEAPKFAAEGGSTVGGLQSIPVEEGGVPVALLRDARWQARSGGERFQRATGTPPRSLKKQFQAAGVPAWQRDAPLLYSADGRLLFVPGLGIDARVLAAPGEVQCSLAWVRRPDA